MKVILVAFVTGALAVSSANATWISMKFADSSAYHNGRYLDIGSGQHQIDINVYAVMGTYSTDRISGVSFSNIAQPGLTQVGCTASLPDWSAAGVNDDFGSNQFAVGAGNPLEDYITGDPGEELLLGVLTIELNAEEIGGWWDVAFDLFDNPMTVGSDTGLLNYHQSCGPYAGYWACGSGWPHGKYYVPGPVHCAGDMLRIRVVPEPGGLSLLALGCLVLVRSQYRN